jgi:hypothetical protein
MRPRKLTLSSQTCSIILQSVLNWKSSFAPGLRLRLPVVDHEVDPKGAMFNTPDALRKLQGIGVSLTFPRSASQC